ncbi:aminotransferase class V-fold PLP-dependent enzyme [Alishewanella sp. HL-SH06]|uniref:aminotransferase class V-fold PLP-dependent enzyme n=1 Tax=Alishewanella sp. HL-SH06 TaxID=3461144 RepID=UPI0040434C39
MSAPSHRCRTLAEVYLDNNATTPVLPAVAAAVMQTMQQDFGNPSSSHSTGIKAKVALEHTRSLARQLLGAATGEIIFTSGATEGIQTSVISALQALRARGLCGPETLLLYGATEHKAVPESLKYWNKLLQINATVQAIPVLNSGLIDTDALRQLLPRAAMVCTMAANNETGVKQDLVALEKLIREVKPDAYWLVDCVQALGKMSLDFAKISIDYAPFSGHKLYGPKGIGFLYVRPGAPYQPLIAGGGQEGGLRSGTENLPGIAALSTIFSQLLNPESSVFCVDAVLWHYRQQLLAALRQVFPALVLNSAEPHILATTLNFAVPGFFAKDILDLFDAAGIRVSSGSACSSKVTGSFVLDAMGLERWRSEGAIRLSFGPAMTAEECDEACKRIVSLAPVVRQHCLVLTDADPLNMSVAAGLSQFKYDANCSYLLSCEHSRQAIIIDPVMPLAERFVNIIQGQGLTLVAVLDTHLHQQANPASKLLRQLLVDAKEQDATGWPLAHDTLQVGVYQLSRIATPGHSPQAYSVLLKQADSITAAFIGDILLPAGIGRTDLDGGSAMALQQSLQLLQATVSEQTLLFSSHDYAQRFVTTFALAKQETPLLQQILAGAEQEQWQQRLNEQSAILQQASTHLCGLVEVSHQDAIALVQPNDLEQLLSTQQITVLDVREPYEQSAGAVDTYLPVTAEVLQIPLSRLCNAMLQQQLKLDQPLLLICRTGNRSLLAARVLRRLGFKQLWNLQGGVALLS